jgi:type IV pilus assembly protein PilM
MSVTLNISDTSIRLLSTKGRRVKKWGSAPLASGLVRDGLILQPKAAGKVIDALFKSTKVARKQVITSLSGLSFTFRIITLPQMKPDLLEEALHRAARKEMPLPLEELYLSWQAIGGKDDELDFFVLGVPRNLIDAVVQTLAEAGIKPYLMELTPLALARAANRGDALIVSLEPDYFDIVLVANGIPTIMHTMTPRGGGASLEDNIRRLTDELLRTVKFYNNSHPENPLSPTTPLLLSGELSSDATASQLIQAEMGYPVEPLTPPLKFPPDFPTNAYATNMGLALKKMPQKAVSKGDATRFYDINLNILPAKRKARARRVPVRRLLLSLGLIFSIGLLFYTYQLKSQADVETMRRQAELSMVSRELHQARLAINEAKQIEDTINQIAADVETLKHEHAYILSKGGSFTTTLKLVTNALPPEAYFTSVNIDTDQITVEGEVDSPFTAINYAEKVQKIFPEARIAEIDEGTGVSFIIAITR